MSPDVEVYNHGSIVIMVPRTERAQDWVNESIPGDALWYGGGFVVEPRYAEDIVLGMRESGLEVA